MTSIFTFAKVSTILVQYFCIKQLLNISLLEDKLGHKQYCSSENQTRSICFERISCTTCIMLLHQRVEDYL